MSNGNIDNKKSIPLLLPIRCVVFLTAFVLLTAISKLSYNKISKQWTTVAIVCNLITIALLLLYTRKKGITYKKLLNYERGKTTIKSAIAIIVLTLTVGMSGLYLAGLICYGDFPYLDKTLVQPIPLWLAIVVLLLLPISTTLAEDGLYLGYAVNSSAGNRWVNASLSAFFYALQHFYTVLAGRHIFSV